jgi:hypothetical protein
MLKLRGLDTPPPGAAEDTVTEAQPSCFTREASTVAARLVLLITVVGRALPFQLTVEAEVKPVPVTVSVNVEPPEAAILGERAEIAGTGLYSAPVTVVEAVAWLLTLFESKLSVVAAPVIWMAPEVVGVPFNVTVAVAPLEIVPRLQ